MKQLRHIGLMVAASRAYGRGIGHGIAVIPADCLRMMMPWNPGGLSIAFP